MARIETDPNYSTPTFSRATAGTDLFKKEDVQALAAAVSTHTHASGKGAVLEAGSIPTGSITSAMLAEGTIVAGDIADGAVTSAKILDGTIATADLADASVTNAKLASDTARASLLVNGGFEIWQRGSGPFTGGVYGPDRWALQANGTDTLSVSRDTANADTALGSATCAAVTFVLASGGGLSRIGNNISALADGQQIANRQLSLSMRVRTNVASAVRLALFDGAAWAYSSFHSGSGTYQTLTATATMGASGAAVGFVAVYFAASCTAYLDNAMLVVGSVAADYAPLHPADDLARCQRYYELLGGGGAGGGPALLGRAAGGGEAWGIPVFWKVNKGGVPTLTVGGTMQAVNCASPSFGRPTPESCQMTTTATAAGAFETYFGTGVLAVEYNP